MSLSADSANSPQRLCAFAAATARLGLRLLLEIRDHIDKLNVGEFRIQEVITVHKETDDRCECGSDCGWWRLVGGEEARRKVKAARGERKRDSAGPVMLCHYCATGHSQPAITKFVDAGASPWILYIALDNRQLDGAVETANAILAMGDVESVASLYPPPDLLPPRQTFSAAAALAKHTLFELLKLYGHGLPGLSRRDAAPHDVQLLCRRALLTGTPIVVTDIEEGELDLWRWDPLEEKRGEVWRDVRGEGLRLEAKCRHGPERRVTCDVRMEDALNRVDGCDGRDDADVLQIADWPHSREHLMCDVLPQSLPSYERMAPDPATMNVRDGLLNLDSKLYPVELPPETGPLFYCGTPRTVTAGHCDSSSAKNDYVMDLSPLGTPQEEKGALWVVFLRNSLEKVITVLARRYKISRAAVVCQNSVVLNAGDVADLLENGVEVCWHVQRLGESVIIPAGCYHTVFNLSANGKVAADYVSVSEVEAVEKVDAYRRAYYTSSPDEPEAGDIARLPVRVLRFLANVNVEQLLGTPARVTLDDLLEFVED